MDRLFTTFYLIIYLLLLKSLELPGKMSSPQILLPSEGASGVKSDGTATATCLCGTVQLAFVSQGNRKYEIFY